jgi:hypothetical protein
MCLSVSKWNTGNINVHRFLLVSKFLDVGDCCLKIGEADMCVCVTQYSIETEFFDEIQTKVLRVFLLANQSHLYSCA